LVVETTGQGSQGDGLGAMQAIAGSVDNRLSVAAKQRGRSVK